MNTTYQYSPEQRRETPDAVGKRLQTTEFAKLFIETAIKYYEKAVPEAASYFPIKETVKVEPEVEVSPQVPVEPTANVYQFPTPDADKEARTMHARKLAEEAHKNEAAA